MGIFDWLFGKDKKDIKSRDLDSHLLDKEWCYHDEYTFLKFLKSKFVNENMDIDEKIYRHIRNEHEKFDGGQIMQKISLFNQLGGVFTVYIEDWNKKKKTTKIFQIEYQLSIPLEDAECYLDLLSQIVGELDSLLKEKIMNIGKKEDKVSKKKVVEQYKIEDDMPAIMETDIEGHKMLKRDMTGLLAYFKEMPNMERIYNEFTHSIRNGYTVEKYLNNTNFMDDNEIRDIVRKGFGVIAGFLEDMLKIKENTELRKDFNACKEVIKILQAKNDD